MAVTVTELQEKLLSQYDTVDILELLDISAEDLVEAFKERLEDRYDYLVKELDLEWEEEDAN